MRPILATTLLLLSTAAISFGGEVEKIQAAAGRLAGATVMYNGKVAPGYFTNTMTCVNGNWVATEKATGWGDAANAYLINGQITTLDKSGNGFNANDGRTYFQGKYAQGFNQLGDNADYIDGMIK